MKKNVLVITGSPRKGGNSDMLAEAFMRGAKAAGHSAVKFDAAADPVQPCSACNACWSKGRACVADDGFVRLAPLLENADAIALCGPVYWLSYSAQLKAAIDKFYAFSGESERKLKGSMYLLMCAGDPSPDVFSFVKQGFEGSAAFLGLDLGGEVLVPGVNEKGDIENTGALARAEQLGRDVR